MRSAATNCCRRGSSSAANMTVHVDLGDPRSSNPPLLAQDTLDDLPDDRPDDMPDDCWPSPEACSPFAASNMKPGGAVANSCSSSEPRRSVRCATTMRVNTSAFVACVGAVTLSAGSNCTEHSVVIRNPADQCRHRRGAAVLACGARCSALPTPLTSCSTCTSSFWKCSVCPLLAAAKQEYIQSAQRRSAPQGCNMDFVHTTLQNSRRQQLTRHTRT